MAQSSIISLIEKFTKHCPCLLKMIDQPIAACVTLTDLYESTTLKTDKNMNLEMIFGKI